MPNLSYILLTATAVVHMTRGRISMVVFLTWVLHPSDSHNLIVLVSGSAGSRDRMSFGFRSPSARPFCEVSHLSEAPSTPPGQLPLPSSCTIFLQADNYNSSPVAIGCLGLETMYANVTTPVFVILTGLKVSLVLLGHIHSPRQLPPSGD